MLEMITNNIIYLINTEQFNDMETFNRFLNLLPENIKPQINRYKFNKDKIHHLLSFISVKYLVSTFHLSDYEILIGKHGKPYLSTGDFKYNISHSENYFAIVISENEIGIDIEFINKDKDYQQIVDRHFHKKEQALYKKYKGTAGIFTKIWTINEAYLKYLGIGLLKELFSFYYDEKSNCIVDDNKKSNVKIYSTIIENNYQLSLCYENSKPIEINELNLDDLLQII